MILALLVACAATTPPQAPAPTVIMSPPVQPPPPGSLWSEVEARALIGMDGNARRVGDLITVRIAESANTSIGADTLTERRSEAAYGIDAALGLDTSILKANPNMGSSIGLGGKAESRHDGRGQTSRTGSLEATITCTVQEVLPNGNLRIRGTKQVRVSRETQYLVLEGVVRPRDILLDNTVQSDLIAEARIEFTGAGVLTDKQGPGWGTRAADALWPF
jgi:flagellar L-ring protein precursor FlgH